MHHEIFVTNRNDFHHTDCYDGYQFDFPPMERVKISVAAAVHMFGFNQPDKTEALTRLGWISRIDRETRTIVEDTEGPRKLAKFVFTKARVVEEVIGDDEPQTQDQEDAQAQAVMAEALVERPKDAPKGRTPPAALSPRQLVELNKRQAPLA